MERNGIVYKALYVCFGEAVVIPCLWNFHIFSLSQ